MSDGALVQLAAELRDLELKRQQARLTEPDTDRRESLLHGLIQRVTQPRPGAERRQHLRIPADLEVRFRMSGAAVTCTASELSYGGLGLRGHLWILQDQELLVENLRLGSSDYPMTVKARVVWKVPGADEHPRAGLLFLDVDESGRRQIRAVFERLFLAFLERLTAGFDPTG